MEPRLRTGQPVYTTTTLSRLFHPLQFLNCWQIIFLIWILHDCTEVREKKNKVVVSVVPTFSTKREIRQFHVIVVQWRQRNVQ